MLSITLFDNGMEWNQNYHSGYYSILLSGYAKRKWNDHSDEMNIHQISPNFIPSREGTNVHSFGHLLS